MSETSRSSRREPPLLASLAARIAPADPGCALLVRRAGRIGLARGYGVRALGHAGPIDERSNFRLGSLTKPFTALATMLLAGEGRLAYTTPVADLLPELAPYGRALTVRHLLTHTSGLPDFEALMAPGGAPREGPARQIRDLEVLALLAAAPAPRFAPGAGWAYSNTGYVLLGLIIAAVSGLSFGRFLEERIFTPSGMRDSVLHEPGHTVIAERAFGHVREAAGFLESDQSATSATQGDGGIYSNLHDLACFDAALEAHTLVSAEALEAALRPVELESLAPARWPLEPGDDNLAPGEPVAYGHGWFVDPALGHARMWHFGQTTGFRTAIMRFPAERLTVAVLCNRTDLDPVALALELAAANLG